MSWARGSELPSTLRGQPGATPYNVLRISWSSWPTTQRGVLMPSIGGAYGLWFLEGTCVFTLTYVYCRYFRPIVWFLLTSWDILTVSLSSTFFALYISLLLSPQSPLPIAPLGFLFSSPPPFCAEELNQRPAYARGEFYLWPISQAYGGILKKSSSVAWLHL